MATERRRARAWCVPWLAAVTVGVVVSGCAGEKTGDGFRVDDRERDAESCGTGDDNTSCPGARQFAIAGNPLRREFAVVWQGEYERKGLGAPVVYARRFDAVSGKARGPSVPLSGVAVGGGVALAYDTTTHTYVVASQDAGPGADAPLPPVHLQRFSDEFRPRAAARDLGSWALKSLAVEERGRVAVVGAENQYAVNGGPRPPGPPLRLRVQTLDARDGTVSVEHRAAPDPTDLFARDVRAAFDPAARALLVVWTPLGPAPPDAIRVERFGPGHAGGALELRAPRGQPAIGDSNLTCNGARGDCLLAYPVSPSQRTPLPDLNAVLLQHGGRSAGVPFRLARESRGAIGAGAHGAGYTIGWSVGLVKAPVTTRVAVARVAGAPPRVETLLDDELPGPAMLGGGASTATDLLVWNPPSGDQGSSQLFGRVLRVPGA